MKKAEREAAAEAAKYRTLEGIQAHPIFLGLTKRQRALLLALFENGNDEEKAIAAIGASRLPSKRALRSMEFRKLRSLYYGYEIGGRSGMSKTELTGILAEILRDPRNSLRDRIRIAGMLERLKTRAAAKPGRPSKEETKEFAEVAETTIDDLVRKIEKDKREGKNPA